LLLLHPLLPSALLLSIDALWNCPLVTLLVYPDDACCTVSSNMGWRYKVITIGAITFVVFVVRYLVFTFHESPKFLISQGRDQDAIDVLHRISKFNKAPMPTLSLAELQLIDSDADTYRSPEAATSSVAERFGCLRGLFLCKLQSFTFALLAIAYMVSRSLIRWRIFISRQSGWLLVLHSSGIIPAHRIAP
jgi:hypothetical protein